MIMESTGILSKGFRLEEEQIINTPRHALFKKICAEAGLAAIRDAQARGLPITYAEGTNIIREYVDGRKESLGHTDPYVKAEQREYILK